MIPSSMTGGAALDHHTETQKMQWVHYITIPIVGKQMHTTLILMLVQYFKTVLDLGQLISHPATSIQAPHQNKNGTSKYGQL